MILSTGMYNITNEKTGEMLVEALPGVSAGTGYTQAAIDSVFPGVGSAFIAIAVFFFAFTTLLSFVLYTDTNASYIMKNAGEKTRNVVVTLLRVVIVAIVLFGATRSSTAAWNLADIGVGIMCWINLIALLVLSSQAVRILKDYERQKKLGLDPVFEPADCGIKKRSSGLPSVKEKYCGSFSHGSAR